MSQKYCLYSNGTVTTATCPRCNETDGHVHDHLDNFGCCSCGVIFRVDGADKLLFEAWVVQFGIEILLNKSKTGEYVFKMTDTAYRAFVAGRQSIKTEEPINLS